MKANRRQFLTSAAAVAASMTVGSLAQNLEQTSQSLKITAVEPIAVRVPEELRSGEMWLFVKLSTNKKGLVGYGEVYTLGIPFGPTTVSAMVTDFAAEIAINQNPYHIEALFQRGYDLGYSHYPDFMRMGILSAVEMACWDIVGKDLNKPVYELLGGAVRSKLRTYTYIWPGDRKKDVTALWRDAVGSAQRAQQYLDQGFTAVKLDPILGTTSPNAIGKYQMMHPIEESLESLVSAQEVIAEVRKAVGNRCDILIGTHGQFTAARAIRFAKRLEPFDPLWFEEPLPPENMEEMALVARGTTIPICSGERLTTKYDFARLIESKAAAILNFDLGRVGGILEARKIAAMAEAHYLQIAPHLWGGPLIAAASVQIDTCCPNFLIQESIGKLEELHAELLKNPIEWKNGFIIPSERPGLGEASAKKYGFK